MRDRFVWLVTSPVTLALALAFTLGGLLIAVTGTNPFSAFAEMAVGGLTGSGLRNSINRAIPIVGMGLAVSVAFRAGVLNLGGEGQLIVGGLAGAVTAIWMPGPGPVVVLASLVAGGLGGALWALVSAFGQTQFKLPILITSLLLNYPARAITGYLVRFPLAGEDSVLASTPEVPAAARIPRLPVLGGVSLTVAIVVVVVVLAAVVYRRSVFGYETEMIGLNGQFARYGGVAVDRRILMTMALSGAMAGMVGTHMVVGEAHRFVDGELVGAGFAWTGLMVSLLAVNRPGGILVAGSFFAALEIGGLAMQRSSDVSWQVAQVIQALVIVALSARIVVRWHRTRQAGQPRVEDPDPDAVGVGEI